LVCSLIVVFALGAEAQEKSDKQPPSAAPAGSDARDRQATLEAKFSKSLSGATLEGSYTLSGAGGDGAKLHREKYTLGEVKKLGGNIWMFPARIQYGDKDMTLPIPLPVEWAGDTPVIVVDNVLLPGFGTVSARVLFFDGHYSGYWKHGEKSGNLFGQYRAAGERSADEAAGEKADKATKDAPASPGRYPAAEKQH
jgi:hypothetical protein